MDLNYTEAFFVAASRERLLSSIFFARLSRKTRSDYDVGNCLEMGQTTAATTGLVDRLEKQGYVERSHALDDRRKIMVKITPNGSGLVGEIRRGVVNKIVTLCASV